MCHKHTHTREIHIPELPPQTLVEPRHAIVRIGGGLPIRDAIEEMSIIRPLLPHALHLRRTRLEIAKVLLAQPRLLPYFDLLARERRRGAFVVWVGGIEGLLRGQGAQKAFGGFPRAAVRGGEDLEGVVGFQEGLQAAAGVFCLGC